MFLKGTTMKRRGLISILVLILILIGVSAQEQLHILKITDVQGITTVVRDASSSSSSTCNSPDFPVLRGGNRKDVDFRELSGISVFHDQTDSEPGIYIKVELSLKNGVTEEYEMIRNIRFTGKTGDLDFSILVKDISTVQIQHP
jgi:hypothetical protein